MPDDRGKALLYDDLVESLTAAEEKVEQLESLVKRMAARLGEQGAAVVERPLEVALADFAR